MFALALCLMGAPALAQDAAQPDQSSADATEGFEDSESDGATQVDPWSGVRARVDRLELRGLGVLVAVPQTDAPEAAISALNEALKLQKLRLQIDDSALGLDANAPDKVIVQAAGNQPVDRILIVRFFPPNPTMIVTVYNLDGSGAGNFALEHGDTTPPADPKLAIADEGASDEIEERSEDTPVEREGPSEADLERYSNEKWVLESFDESGLVLRNGATGELFDGPEALDILGQANEAEEMRSNLSLKRVLYWTGAGLAGAGLISLVVGFFTIPTNYDADDPPIGNFVAIIGGFGGMFAGIISAVVGWNIDAIDATRKEARGWVDDKNAPLREELEIPPHLSGAPAQPAGFTLSWRF